MQLAGGVESTGLSFTHDCCQKRTLEVELDGSRGLGGSIPVYGDMGAERVEFGGCRRGLRNRLDF